MYDKTGRTSVYVAYPGSDYQIEVFDPTPGNAPELVRSGAIVVGRLASLAGAVRREGQ